VLAGALGLAAFLVEAEFLETAEHGLDARLRVEAEALASLTRFDGKTVTLSRDDDVMAPFSARSGAFFEISWEQGTIARSPSLGEKELPRPSELLEDGHGRHGHGHRQRAVTVEGPLDAPVRLVALPFTRPIMGDEGPDGPRATVLVQVARPMNELDHARSEVNEALGVAMPLALVLGTLGAFVVARRATAPIRRLTREAAEIDESRLNRRLDVAGVVGELEELAGTLNEAFDRLASGVAREKRFSSDVAHELRTPLAIARSTLELALSRERSPGEYQESLGATLEAVIRLDAIVSALLVLGRAESGSLERRSVDLGAVLRTAADAVAPVAARASVPVKIFVPDAVVVASGHAQLLERLVVNLLENGVRHGASSEGVEATLEANESAARITVRDRGPGLPAGFMERAFERFARADESRARVSGGAGLGLAIARAIARAHRGELSAAARSGGGAEFVVTIPRESQTIAS
jgi:signal transduction histidine kinase